jgi:hypothetical protein
MKMSSERMQKLAQLIHLNPKTWDWPTFKPGSITYPHHSPKEMKRRRGQ